MTVHGAKGLEAPIVFLIDTCTTPQSARVPWLFARGDDEGPIPLLRAKKEERDPICDQLVAREQENQMAEYRRQLYVAMTRARDRLYIAGVNPAKGYAGSWHETLSEAFDRQGEFKTVETDQGPVLRLGTEPLGRTIGGGRLVAATDVAAWALRPAGKERPVLRRTPSALLPEEETMLPVLAPFSGARDPFLRGRVIHKLLQLLPEIARETRAVAARRLLALAPYRALAAQQEDIIGEVVRLIDSSDFATVFGLGSKAEVPISGALLSPSGQRLFISGQIDRLLVTDDEILIVDFKTNRPPPTSAADVPRQYRSQMAAYARLLAEALPGRTIRAALIFTAVPRLIELDIANIDVTEVTAGG
jgi:ATP-dependent helicase/nuclease subunit A